MGNLQKDQQTFAELDRTRKETLAQADNVTNQQLQLNPQPTPQEELSQLVSQLESSVRQQQLKTEQTIQQTLQQASTALNDAQNIDALFLQVQTLQQAINQPGGSNNPQSYPQLLQQLESKVRQQLQQADEQLAQALQQTVSSMAQAQVTMTDKQTYNSLVEKLKQCEKVVQKWQTTNPPAVH
ncbi:MAG TPA: hypothetical protein VFC74_10445 [Oscillospiraceae bacterium]|nr:hypothetical protein [Oscillospiraceae bacterium]